MGSRHLGLVRAGLVLALIPLAVYLVPRATALIAMPTRLDVAVMHARSYNPRLPVTAAQDDRATLELASLDRIDRAVARVRASDGEVSGELVGLAGQIRGDVQAVLDRTNSRVGSLLVSLDALTTALEDLENPIADARKAVSTDRARLARTIRIAEDTAEHAHRARRLAEQAADDLTGPGEGGRR
ncbi:MAG TPA: hypothetical protein VL595_25285 [Pseudonocardia sp.]|jgi:hypothetical protein|nr:hypothetical protein [Pseudonocardia sp.]